MSDRPQKITFAELREMGVRGLLVYCAALGGAVLMAFAKPLRKSIFGASSMARLWSPVQNANFSTSNAKAPTQSTVTVMKVTDRITLIARSCELASVRLNALFID